MGMFSDSFAYLYLFPIADRYSAALGDDKQPKGPWPRDPGPKPRAFLTNLRASNPKDPETGSGKGYKL